MQYELVFDAAEAGYRHGWLLCIPLVLAIAGTGLLVLQRTCPEVYYNLPWSPNNVLFKQVFPWVYTSFAMMAGISVLTSTYGEYRRLRDALHSGRYEVVEGTVTGFVPMPWAGHAMESFCVGGRRYEYSDYEVSAGFNQTRSHGGPLDNGVRVRIADVDGVIARLEIARQRR